MKPGARAYERQRRMYAKTAATYDGDEEFFERWITGSGHRSWACSRAVGDTLEVGIGTGLNIPHYPTDVSLVGIDLSPEMLSLASVRAVGLERTVELMEADAMRLPFLDDTFDTVVCTYVLCSVPDDRRAIAEMERVLRPGGRLVLVDHVRSTFPPFHWVQWLYEFVPRRTKGEYWTRRPAEHVEAQALYILEHGRLRAGVIERLVAVKDHRGSSQ